MSSSLASFVFFVLVLVVIALLISAALLKWLWNITIPDIFEIRAITMWEALRLMLISALLFGAPFGYTNF
ncbi:MAG: hypothetical protein LC637_04690 [Xanthomonadaceae bacterium]|nr:hypothetical protein [Xanthomonadaceae bacterium]